MANKQYRIDELIHYGVKGQKWGVRRYQNKNGTLTAAGKAHYKKYWDDEYDEERERHEQEVAARRGVKYVRKTKKEREAEDAENERKEKERRDKEDAAYKRTEDKMKEIDKKLQSKYDFSSDGALDKYYKEYDDEWFKILSEERKKEGLSHFDLSDDELIHHGIKGQKWGRRRYQNKDGSLTPAGEKRYGSKENFEENYDSDVKKSMSNTKEAIDKANKTIKPFNDGANNRQSNREKRVRKEAENAAREEARKMTDQELRDVVNRLNMEERYTQVMRDRSTIDAGRTSVEKFMDRTATALTVASTAMSIAIMIKELKK